MSKLAAMKHSRTRFEQLLSYRLHLLVNVNERAANMLYARKFGITLNEWRVMALLGECERLPVNEIARRTDLDKSRVSRLAAGLVKRRYLSRSANKDDARSVMLKLTPVGLAIHGRMFTEESLRRQERLLSCLNKSERDHIESAIDKLIAEARLIYEEERLADHRPAHDKGPEGGSARRSR
jgi:DNA-binding MarR family transcriptional regulator